MAQLHVGRLTYTLLETKQDKYLIEGLAVLWLLAFYDSRSQRLIGSMAALVELPGSRVVSTEKDIPGAALDIRRLETYTVSSLRLWLQ